MNEERLTPEVERERAKVTTWKKFGDQSSLFALSSQNFGTEAGWTAVRRRSGLAQLKLARCPHSLTASLAVRRLPDRSSQSLHSPQLRLI